MAADVLAMQGPVESSVIVLKKFSQNITDSAPDDL